MKQFTLFLTIKTFHCFVYVSYLFYGLKTGCVLAMVEQPSMRSPTLPKLPARHVGSNQQNQVQIHGQTDTDTVYIFTRDFTWIHGLINYIDTNAKCRHVKN
jgi:hypothetical protein